MLAKLIPLFFYFNPLTVRQLCDIMKIKVNMKKNLLNFEDRLVIEASAGSGKTYQLAKRFIHLLSLYLMSNSKSSSNLCRINNMDIDNIATTDSLGSIVAITFTNKAAAEMKERILLFLKKLSLLYKDNNFNKNDFAISKENALRALIEIIKNLGELNVTTIDSFMNRIIKAFSVDLSIYPDYDINFNSDEIFQFAVDDLISDTDNHRNLIIFLQDMLYLGKKGVNGEKIIFNSLQDFQNIDIPNDVVNLKHIIKIFTKKFNLKGSSYNEIKDEIEEKIKKNAIKIDNLIEENKTVFNGTKIKSYKNMDIKKATEKISQIKQLIESKNLESILKKNQQLNKEDSDKFIECLNGCYELSTAYIILRHTYQTESIAKQIVNLRKKEEEIKSSLNIIDGSKIAKSVGNILNTDYGVSEAFCKLGEKITHYLIDEFQDTSKEQFEALYALIENGVAKGGSLFVVGDKKQAIYAWRGGDYNIFDTLLAKKELNIKTQTTENNYRSKSSIIEFNNTIFSSENLLNDEITKPLDENFKSSIEKDIEKLYKSSRQECKAGNGGYVKVLLKTVKDSDIDTFYRSQIKETIKTTLNDKKIPLSDIMILLRTKKEIRKVTNWLMEDFPNLKFITDDSLLLINNFEIKRFLFLISSIIFKEDKRYKKAFDEIGLRLTSIEELYSKSQNSSAYELFCYILEKGYFNLDDNKIYFNKLLEETLILTQKQKSLYEIVDYFYKNTDIAVELPENTEALKITTIHKSKGLESHTVILPFYDWKLYDAKNIDIYKTFSIEDFADKGDTLFAKVDKNLRDISKDANQAYLNQLKINFIEALNLAYVANTRAKENLFIFGINSLNKDGTIPKNITVANLIYKILNKENKENKENFETGELKNFQESDSDKKNDKKNYALNAKIGSSIRSHLKIYQTCDIDTDIGKKPYGELFHLAMSYIEILHKDDSLKEKATEAYWKAVSVMNFEDENIISDIISAIDNLKYYFIDIEQCWNEKEFVSKQGEILRIDRLVRKNSNYFVIDYKTGLYSAKHENQVRNYMKLFKNSAKGILYYTKNGRIVNVN